MIAIMSKKTCAKCNILCYILLFLSSEHIDTVRMRFADLVFVRFADTLFITLIILSHRTTESPTVLFKYLLL